MALWARIVDALFSKNRSQFPQGLNQGSLYRLVGRSIVFLDFETTGIDPTNDRAIEIAGSRHDQAGRTEFHSLLNPGIDIPEEVSRLTGITNESIVSAPIVAEVLSRLQPLLSDNPVIVAHNAIFDVTVLMSEQRRARLPLWNGDFVCTRALATLMGKGTPSVNRAGRPYVSYKLSDVAKALGLSLEGAHRAGSDIQTTEEVFRQLYPTALQNSMPILNTTVQPKWARTPEYLPKRARVHITDN